jgi:hypothetical protein
MSESEFTVLEAVCCCCCPESEFFHPQEISEFVLQAIIPKLFVCCNDVDDSEVVVDPDSEWDNVFLESWMYMASLNRALFLPYFP